MLRLLALSGLHLIANFALLGSFGVVSHPIHHDDYGILGAHFHWGILLGPRPVSNGFIAGFAALGPELGYVLLNLLTVGVVWLSLRFAELFVREGRPLPVPGYLAAGLIALSYPGIADWSRYLGLVTNLSSAILGLIVMCLLVRLQRDNAPATGFRVGVALLAAMCFFAKEDFALPILLTGACVAFLRRDRAMLLLTVSIGILFGLALAFNWMAGSAYISGGRGASDLYAIDFGPASVLHGLDTLLLHTAHGRWVTGLAFGVALLLAIARWRDDRPLVLRAITLPVAAISILLPYAILPNHLMPYYSFPTIAMLASALAACGYAIAETRAVGHAYG